MQTKITIKGTVQGVGYRYWTKKIAQKLHLMGNVKNQNDGSVIAMLDGSKPDIHRFIDLARSGPSAANVTELYIKYCEFDCQEGFQILR